VKPVAFEYVRPHDIAGAIAAARQRPESKFIAGGQSLGPMLNLRLARPSVLIDISLLPDLREAHELASSWLIGAAVTHAEIEDGRTPIGSGGILPEVARQIAYRAIRNRGTIGGSLAHADAAADWPLALSACGASVHLRSPAGARTLAMSDFLRSAFTTALGDYELVTAIEIPKLSKTARWGYYKLCRKAGEFPIASAAIVLDDERCAAFLGALSDRPRPMMTLAGEIARTQSLPSTDQLIAAVGAAAPELDAIDRRIFVACAARAVSRALQR
jgi:aerobic carbon-monoxide dehydrogenase medium subunit